MTAKSLTERVYNTLRGWGEPIATADLLDYLGMANSRKTRQQVSAAITDLKKRDGLVIESARAVKGKGGVAYRLVSTPPTTIRFNRIPDKNRPNKTKEFVDALREKETAENAVIDSKPEDDQTFERMVESARQKEIAEEADNVKPAPDLRIAKESGKSNPLLQAYPTKDLRAYEGLCYHYIRSRKGLTSSIQVADYYELTKEEGACLLTRVSKRFPAVELTVYAKV